MHQFFLEEKGNRYPVIHPSQVMERTAKATKVSYTMRGICVDEKRNVEAGNPFRFSLPTRNKEDGALKRDTNFDDCDMAFQLHFGEARVCFLWWNQIQNPDVPKWHSSGDEKIKLNKNLKKKKKKKL